MMRRLLCTLTQTLLFAIAALASQQSPAESVQVLDSNRSEWVAPTATVNGRVRVIITKHKPKLHLPKPQRPVIQLALEDDDTDYYNELPDLQIGYRRPELIDQTAEIHDDISDEIKIRLVLARRRALESYHANWSQRSV
jgi:hypothetical protein